MRQSANEMHSAAQQFEYGFKAVCVSEQTIQAQAMINQSGTRASFEFTSAHGSFSETLEIEIPLV